MELVAASSSIEAGIGCWDLTTGKEQLRYKHCTSPPHGLVCVGHRFLASSQLRDPSGSVQYWSWSKPQVDVNSHPAEPIKPLAANSAGTYIVGGGVSGNIYLWEVSSGRLLKKWPAHYRAVSCLVFSDDDSLLISGSEDGGVRVWSLIQLFDDEAKRGHLYLYDFTEHSLSVTDVVIGFGGGNAIIVSASEDRTCKVRSLSNGRLLRDIVFPSIIDAIALDPAEQVFHAGGRDGKIYVAALNAPSSYNSKYGLHIVGCFSNQSKAVTCLAYGITGNYLISGSEDGRIRVWDARTHNLVRMFQHAKGPVNNILVIRLRQQLSEMNSQASSKRHGSLLPPPLEKYASGEDTDIKVFIGGQNTCSQPPEALYVTSHVMESQIQDLQQQGSASSEMEIDRLKREQERLIQNNQQLKRLYDNLHEFMVNDLFNRDQAVTQNGSSA